MSVAVFALACVKYPAAAKDPAFAKNPAIAKESVVPKMYVLQQKSASYGDEVCYIAPDALRIDLKASDCAVYVLKPFTEIEIVNSRQKTFFRGALATWEGKPLRTKGYVRNCLKQGCIWQKLSPSEICSMPADHLVLEDPAPNKVGKKRSRLDYWQASDLIVNPILANAFAQLGGLAITKKLPLKYEYKTGGVTSTLFDTQRIEMKAVDAKLFVIPPKLKRVDSDLNVYFAVGENELDGLNSIIYRSEPEGSGSSIRKVP